MTTASSAGPATAAQRSLGKQSISTEGDIAFLRWEGDINGEEMTLIMDEFYRVLDDNGTCFVLINMTHAKTVSGEARKRVLRYNDRAAFTGCVCFNASFTTRVIAGLIINAFNLVRPASKRMETTFVKTEEEARAWINTTRAAVLKKRG